MTRKSMQSLYQTLGTKTQQQWGAQVKKMETQKMPFNFAKMRSPDKIKLPYIRPS